MFSSVFLAIAQLIIRNSQFVVYFAPICAVDSRLLWYHNHTEMGNISSSSSRSTNRWINNDSNKEEKEWNIILLGDSTIDNKGYCDGGASVTEQFGCRVGAVELRARDGAMIAAIERQLLGNPISADVTHFVISVGGNDCLGNIEILKEECLTVADGLLKLRTLKEQFEEKYEAMLNLALGYGKKIMLAAVYHPCFSFEHFRALGNQEATEIAESIFHDVIFRLARQYTLPVVDLRAVIDEATDYANPIELNSQGGQKLVNAILQAIRIHQTHPNVSVVYPQTAAVVIEDKII